MGTKAFRGVSLLSTAWKPPGMTKAHFRHVSIKVPGETGSAAGGTTKGTRDAVLYN